MAFALEQRRAPSSRVSAWSSTTRIVKGFFARSPRRAMLVPPSGADRSEAIDTPAGAQSFAGLRGAKSRGRVKFRAPSSSLSRFGARRRVRRRPVGAGAPGKRRDGTARSLRRCRWRRGSRRSLEAAKRRAGRVGDCATGAFRSAGGGLVAQRAQVRRGLAHVEPVRVRQRDHRMHGLAAGALFEVQRREAAVGARQRARLAGVACACRRRPSRPSAASRRSAPSACSRCRRGRSTPAPRRPRRRPA